MPISQCIQAHTYKEYRAWMIWLDKEWNRPSRTDFYLMQIAKYIATTNSKKATQELDKYKVPFETKAPESTFEKAKKATASKMAWIGAVFGKRP